MIKAPIIIIGCHRSGTSIFTSFLRQNGFYMGNKYMGHDEAKYFFDLNVSTFNSVDSKWNLPVNLINKIKSNSDWLNNISKIHKRKIYSKDFINSYLDKKNLFKFIFNRSFIWGWKDPRNTITLPIWLKVFPEAKIIHLHRHGLDVALSLMNRELKREKNNPLFAENCTTLEGAFKLWELYENAALENTLGSEKILRIRYEEFVTNPRLIMSQIERFIGNVSFNYSPQLDSSKAYKYKSVLSPDHYKFIYDSPILSKLGYVK